MDGLTLLGQPKRKFRMTVDKGASIPQFPDRLIASVAQWQSS